MKYIFAQIHLHVYYYKCVHGQQNRYSHHVQLQLLGMTLKWYAAFATSQILEKNSLEIMPKPFELVY